MPKFSAVAKAIGLGVVKTMVPQIAIVEESIRAAGAAKAGPDRQRAVIDAVVASVEAAEGVSGKDLVQNEDFAKALRMINDGTLLLMKSVAQHETTPEPEDGTS